MRLLNFEKADALVLKTQEIIDYFNPPIWWIENPRTGFLQTREIIKGIPFVNLDYCQFSDWGYQKPTRIWCCSEIAKLPHRTCDFVNCTQLIVTPNGSKRHRERLGGLNMKYDTREKGRMPPAAIEYLLSAFPIMERMPNTLERLGNMH